MREDLWKQHDSGMQTMHRFSFLVFLGIITICYSESVKNITIGYLTVDKSKVFMRDKQGRAISGAISWAIEKINNDTELLNGYRLNLVWGDTQADTLVSTLLLTHQWRDGAVAFIGVEDSCSVEAKVAAAWNLPMISYKCADYEVSKKDQFPTFARTFPPATQVAKPIVSLLLHYKWRKFTLVVGDAHKPRVIAEKLQELAAGHNLTINDMETFKEPHIPLTTGNPFPGIVERTFVDTRVYVFLGGLNGIVDMMTNLYDRGLLDTGEYIVIYVDHETFDPHYPLKYFHRTADDPSSTTNMEAVRSLLVITPSPPINPDYENFKTIVSLYGEKPPFNFPNPFNKSRVVTVFAAYLYDAMMLYAEAATEVLKEGGSLTNGTAIIQKICGKTYTGIQGHMSHIDENGDAEGNYTLLSRKEIESNLSKYSMQPVGYFEMDTAIPIFKPQRGIDWVSGSPPIDEPPCGYRGQRCIPPKTYTLEIVGGILGGIALIALIIILIVYRNWRYEQEIAGLLWKIAREDLKSADSTTSSNRRESFGSRMTLTQLSIDSRMSFTQVYAKTGTYKGQIVALKVYEKKNLQISRKMQKEMKLMRDLRHTNTNAFLGTCIDPPYFIIVTEYCPKGSLLDILENEDLKLDNMFIASLVKDIIQGMIFIHDSELHYHGNLKSSNCVVNSRWSLQITDFGLLEVRAGTYKQEEEHAYYRNLFWKSPEHLRKSPLAGSPKGDVYSFGIILHEIFGRAGPFGLSRMSPREVIERVKAPNPIPYRPDIEQLTCDKYIIECMISCWDENPDERPDFREVWRNLQPLRHGMKRNIFDNMMAMMEKYQENLEDIVDERTTLLNEEKKKTEALLLRMLPRSVAEQLKRGESVIPESYNCVTIYFSDICSFTELSASSTPMEVVDMLNDLYTTFDSIVRNYDVYKVETIGDAYMVVSGLPIRNGDNHAGEVASMSLHLLRAIKSFKIRHRPNEQLQLRIGMHSGPCVAGVVGLTMPRYTLFGDTVNTASRMETNGEPMKVHCSGESKKLLDKLGGYKIEPRGNVAMKGKGELFTYWLVDEDESVRQQRASLSNKRLLSLCESQPCTPTTSARCLNCFQNKYRSSPRSGPPVDVLNDNEETNNINSDNDTNFLDLIKMSDNIKSPRSDSPKHFFQQALRSDSPKTYNTIQGHENLKLNGVLSDNLANKSSSGSNLQRPGISLNLYQEVEDGQTETDSLLIRTHSLGNKPKWRPNSPLMQVIVPSRDGKNVGEFQLDSTSTESLQTSIV